MRLLYFIIGFLMLTSCKKNQEKPNELPLPDGLILYYEKTVGEDLQVFRYNGNDEINLSNDKNYSYWWIKVNQQKNKNFMLP